MITLFISLAEKIKTKVYVKQKDLYSSLTKGPRLKRLTWLSIYRQFTNLLN